MIARPPLPPAPYLVVGLARSGVAAALTLRARGAEVVGVDAGPVPDEVAERLLAAGAAVHARHDGVDLLARAGSVVKSPGVPKEAPVIAAARERGLAVLGEFETGWRLLPEHEFIAVTGSNGKTTTVELIGHLHREAGVRVKVAGNVGTALTGLPGTLATGTVVVAEASSFQLEDTEAFAPEAAVLLNLAEDHLDRHGTFAAYRAAKLEIFARQPRGAVAVAPLGLAIEERGEARRVRFGAGPGAELADRAGRLWWGERPLLPVSELGLRGDHNVQNAMAAAAVCLARGLEPQVVAAGLRTFRGLAHRLEEVGTADGVLYVNDSKATNVASALVGLASFPGGVHAILGGRSKGGGFAELAPVVAERCRAAYLIGETAPQLRHDLEPAGVPLHDCGDLEHAVGAAAAAARPGEVVLLSPACPSFDQYESYEARGDHFRALARARMSST